MGKYKIQNYRLFLQKKKRQIIIFTSGIKNSWKYEKDLIQLLNPDRACKTIT